MSSMILLTTKFCSSASFVHHTSHAHFPGVSRATTILQTHTLRSFSSASIVAFKDESNFISGDDEDFTDEISRTETLPNEHGKKLFKVTAKFPPTGHQPKAIDQLTKQLLDGDKYSILQGITGTGKTLVMAHTIANVNVGPTLVLVHNKTLAAQLARELRAFLKENAVELFISYYDHYVPESFVETTGKYIAKKTAINKEIDALRHKATRALLTRDDVVVVASVSCIYGLGLPKEYLDNSMRLHAGTYLSWKDFMNSLDRMLYDVSVDDGDFERGQYQLYEETLTDNKNRKTIVLWPPHERFPMQIIMDQDSLMDSDRFRVASIRTGNQLGLTDITSIHIFPAKHHVIGEERLETACQAIEDELSHRVKELMAEGKYIESERLQQRTLNDLMIIRETGFCSGIENYSRHFAGKAAGERPDTLMDYLAASGRKWLLVIDESHVTLPQLSAMYAGDQARKRRLVKHGYRLPSALDNRPLKDSEFWDQVEQTVFVSATPSKKELVLSKKSPIEMFIRPTFVCDPKIEVRPKKNQLESLLAEIQQRATKQERCLAVAITKRDAEDLSSYLNEKGVRSTFIHSGLKPHARSEALKALQNGEVDCLVGVNLLREGLDLPQVSLVAILSADSEGFLRSETSLLQTVGRAARNINGHAIFFADQITESMRKCIESTEERRRIQLDFNEFHGHKMMSTKGASTMSIFDLTKDEIDAELENVVERDREPNSIATRTVENMEVKSSSHKKKSPSSKVQTDHIPSLPGCYFWRDANGRILYIGKANKLRSRVRSYLSPNARHGTRIQVMVSKADSVDVIVTPSERDALVLESNLIKHHQPPFNVLLKDDEHYPYICASVGDPLPRLFVAPRVDETMIESQRHHYFGPYTSFKEINSILDGIENEYNLRQQSFLARHGDNSKEEYQKLFERVLSEVFGDGSKLRHYLNDIRAQYEEAGLLFDSKYNENRDVVVVEEMEESSVIVYVVQLRQGTVKGRFSYQCKVPIMPSNDDDKAEIIQTVLMRYHYPSGRSTTWFPDDLLLAQKPHDSNSLVELIRKLRKNFGGRRKKTTITFESDRRDDTKALEFAIENSMLEGFKKSNGDRNIGLVDGKASKELQELLRLDILPRRIECYDISHTAGSSPVASRVVFIDGNPAKQFYRRFNIKSIDGIDDFAAIEEALFRRFRRADSAEEEDSWKSPDLVLVDGGKWQLSAAVKGMEKAGVRSRIPVCALAKDPERVFIPGEDAPVNIEQDSPGMLLLRSLRDEAHRFALAAHRRLRSLVKKRH